MAIASVEKLMEDITGLAKTLSGDGDPTKYDWKSAAEQVYIENLPEGLDVDNLQRLKAYSEKMGSAITQTAGRDVIMKCKADPSLDGDSVIIKTPFLSYSVGVVKKTKKDGERKLFSTTYAGISFRNDEETLTKLLDTCDVTEKDMATFEDM